MAYKLVDLDWAPGTALVRNGYVLDSADDAASLPKAPTGSVAIVADKDGPMYMVNASGEWKEL